MPPVAQLSYKDHSRDLPFALDGKCLACTFRAKFIEVSVGINHNVDELLAGILTQIRLKQEHNLIQVYHFIVFFASMYMLYFVNGKHSGLYRETATAPARIGIKVGAL